jgi:hypothetical protein
MERSKKSGQGLLLGAKLSNVFCRKAHTLLYCDGLVDEVDKKPVAECLQDEPGARHGGDGGTHH